MKVSVLDNIYTYLDRITGAPRTTRWHYLFAFVIILSAAFLRYSLQPVIGTGFVFILFYPAVVLAAWLGGFGPGILATVLSSAISWFLFYYINEHQGPALRQIIQLLVFAFSCTFISLLSGLLHQIMRKQKRLNQELFKEREELFKQREWFRVTLTSIGDAVIVTDKNGLITFMNSESERLTGWSFQDAQAKALRAVFRIINEESRKSVDDPVEKVFKEKRVVGLANHTILISKQGTEWPIEDSASPIHDENKEIIGVVLVFHDATELRRAERAIKIHADELEKKVFERTISLQRTVNELEAFSYTVSHDLRSPLRAMQGYAIALVEDFSDKWPKEAKDYLQRISKAAERLDNLIQDLLTYTRVTGQERAVEPLLLDGLVRDIIQQYPNFHSEQTEIVIEGELPTVLGHESALTQVVANLLSNAVKFKRGNEKPIIKIRAEILEHTAKIWIEDNGIGIAPENHQRIFKMFEQVHGQKSFGGTGIGLALVKKAIEEMHGTVGVESAENSGSRFWFELLRAKKL